MIGKILKVLLKVLSHPVTQVNLLTIGVLIMIQMIHTHAHHTMDIDVHAYVKAWCSESEENRKKCSYYGQED